MSPLDRRAVLYGFILGVLVAVIVVASARGAAPPANYGGGEGGYTQLPACGPSYYGQTLYVQGRYWRCVQGAPDHWAPS